MAYLLQCDDCGKIWLDSVSETICHYCNSPNVVELKKEDNGEAPPLSN